MVEPKLTVPQSWELRCENLACNSAGLPDKALHIRSLCNGLNSVRSSLMYVKNVLEDEDIPWHQVQDTVAIQLATSAMLRDRGRVRKEAQAGHKVLGYALQ